MSKVLYRRLSDDARHVLEQDLVQRRLFLDFLGVLEDVLASKSVAPEPPLFTREEQQVRIGELTELLTFKAGVRDAAAANREGVFAVEGKEASKFLSELLSEYDQVRLIAQGRRRVAVR